MTDMPWIALVYCTFELYTNETVYFAISSSTFTCTCTKYLLKPGFHYPSSRPEYTARIDGCAVSISHCSVDSYYRRDSNASAHVNRLNWNAYVHVVVGVNTVSCMIETTTDRRVVYGSVSVSCEVVGTLHAARNYTCESWRRGRDTLR